MGLLVLRRQGDDVRSGDVRVLPGKLEYYSRNELCPSPPNRKEEGMRREAVTRRYGVFPLLLLSPPVVPNGSLYNAPEENMQLTTDEDAGLGGGRPRVDVRTPDEQGGEKLGKRKISSLKPNGK